MLERLHHPHTMMKRHLVYFNLFLCSLAGPAMSAQVATSDIIMFKTGETLNAHVVQVSKNEITYKLSNKKNEPLQTVDLTDAYMIKFAKRGNVYITPEGKRITGENQKIDRHADVIYLVKGGEIQAYNLQIGEDKIVYQTSKKAEKGRVPQQQVLAPFQVFMIIYSDGTRDLITDLTQPDPLRYAYVVPEEFKQPEVAPEVAAEPEQQVVFHSVKRGESLGDIATRYNVTVENLKEWNDLPKQLKAHAKLQSDMQLMIYVQPVEQ